MVRGLDVLGELDVLSRLDVIRGLVMLDWLDTLGGIEVLGGLDVLGGLLMGFISYSICIGDLKVVFMVRSELPNRGLVDPN